MNKILFALLVFSAAQALAVPPPPPPPPVLRSAKMTMKISYIRQSNPTVITPLCEVSGEVPVYDYKSDSAPTVFNQVLPGCRLVLDGVEMEIKPGGYMQEDAINTIRVARAAVYVRHPDSPKGCDFCAPPFIGAASGASDMYDNTELRREFRIWPTEKVAFDKTRENLDMIAEVVVEDVNKIKLK